MAPRRAPSSAPDPGGRAAGVGLVCPGRRCITLTDPHAGVCVGGPAGEGEAAVLPALERNTHISRSTPTSKHYKREK